MRHKHDSYFFCGASQKNRRRHRRLHTLEAQVAHVQDGGQQLGNLPVLRLREHEHLHGRQDAGVIAQVVTTIARRAVPLVGEKQRDAESSQDGHVMMETVISIIALNS